MAGLPHSDTVDDATRECLGLVVNSSLCLRVVCELDRIAELRGHHCMIVSDNRIEPTSNVIPTWQQQRGVEWHYIAPDKQNAEIASSSASTDVCVTSASTSTSSTPLSIIEKWRTNSNTNRPHSSLNGSHQPSSQRTSTRGEAGTDPPYKRGQVGEQVTATASIREGWESPGLAVG